MKGRTVLLIFIRVLVVLVLGLSSMAIRKESAAQAGNLALYVEREIELEEVGLKGLGSLAYSPEADVFVFLAEGPGLPHNSVSMVDRLEHVVGSTKLMVDQVNPMTLAFNPLSNSLYAFDPTGETLLQIPADRKGKLSPNAPPLRQHNFRGLGTGQVSGAAFDPGNGRLFALDANGKRLLIVTPDSQAGYDTGAAVRENRLAWIDLKSVGIGQLRGLAFNIANQHLYTLSLDPFAINEFTDAGSLVATADVSSSGLVDPQAIVIAPSGDHTDDPANQTIYVADPGRNVIVEFAYDTQVASLMALTAAFTVVNTIRSSTWNPPSPDPVGLDVFPNGDLLISDSEVDEMPIYDGANVFRTRPNGNLQSTCTTLAFSKEPTGVAINPANGMVFISDDGKDRVFKIDVGNDGIYCTNDDNRTTLNPTTYGVTDPEGIAFGANRLILTEGLGKQVIVVQPGNNGNFDGAPPAGDDTYTQFDTLAMGLRDPEGIGYHPTRNSLFIVSRNDKILVETTLDGTVLNIFDIRPLDPISPGGVGIGPGSQNPGELVVYVSDRGVDNNSNPNENDGRIFEISVGSPSGPTPTPTPTPSSTPPPGGQSLYLSLQSNMTTVGSVSAVRDEDILFFNGSAFSMYFDGSDVGIGGVDVDAFYRVDADTILLSLDAAITLPGAGAVQNFDVLQFDATSLGSNTAGSFSLYLDGEDVGLDTSAENIDAIDVLGDGTVIISTSGNPSVAGVTSPRDEDLLAFTPTSLGSATSGTWAMYFDGSDVGLETTSSEDVDAFGVSSTGQLHLSTLGAFSVSGVSGDGADIFTCSPGSLGGVTACSFSSSLFFDGSAFGITVSLDGFDLP
jgi:uncharacterized protein YjiK